MPFDRAHLNGAMRIMVPLCTTFFAVIGSSFTFAVGGLDRLLATPMLRYADRIMPLQVWGCVFLTCAAIMVLAMLLRHRSLYRYGLLVCGLSMCVWALVAMLGIFAEPVSYSAWAWPGFVAGSVFAMNRSLARGARISRTGR